MIYNSIKKFDNFKLEFTNVGNFLENEWVQGNFAGHNKKNQFTKETLIQCFPGRFFPQYEKIIYSDVDCVFVDDISELIDINLDNEYLAAVKVFPKDQYPKNYFAGGLWVINLKKIREDNLEEKILEIVKDDTISKQYPDQDIMYYACENKVKFIPLNYISYPYLQDRINSNDFEFNYSREELYDSIINPKIIHYAAFKPWHNCAKNSEIWWSIFYYLNLPKTSIFRDNTNIPEINSKKIKKYKKLFKIFLFISIILFLLLILFYYK